jgi:hypothetical protein
VLSSVSLGSGRVSESVLTNVAAAEIEVRGRGGRLLCLASHTDQSRVITGWIWSAICVSIWVCGEIQDCFKPTSALSQASCVCMCVAAG